MDRLAWVLNRFSMNANVFFSGNLCGIQSFGDSSGSDGHLHLLKSGTLALIDDEGKKVVLSKPSVMFIPGSTRHQILASESDKAELVCAHVSYEDGLGGPLVNALPKLLHFEIKEADLLGQSAHWLFDEAFNERCGRQPMIDRLCDIFLIQVLRRVMDEGVVSSGMLAGLADSQLAKVLTAIHQNPEKNWTLENMAEMALMSRSKFADVFRSTVGQPPGDYIMEWRIAVAQRLLKRNKPVGLVANEVGYENGSALARVFRKKIGLSPREWLDKIRSDSVQVSLDK